MTGAVLVVLFIAEGPTLLSMGDLLSLHVFLGMLLIGPVSLKIGSTLWRFIRYYTGWAPCVRKGPPDRPQRVLGPFVILTHGGGHRQRRRPGRSGSGNGPWGRIHHLSFLVWLAVFIIRLASSVPKLLGDVAGVPRQKYHGSFGVKELEGRTRSCPRTWRRRGGGSAGSLAAARRCGSGAAVSPRAVPLPHNRFRRLFSVPASQWAGACWSP